MKMRKRLNVSASHGATRKDKDAEAHRAVVLIALTGTPGTGKKSVGAVLTQKGYAVLDLDDIARREGCIVGRDDARGSDELDIDLLRAKLHVPAKLEFLEGHYSHLMPVNIAVVLRCHPKTLGDRLRARGWPEAKVRENVEAEAIDVITQEAVARLTFVYEIDTTSASAAASAQTVLELLQGRTAGHEPGRIDWGTEVLSWY